MKTLLKSSIAFLLLLVPVLAFGQQVLQIMNVGARQITSLDGQWKTIVDPFENGYYDYRLKPYDGGYNNFNKFMRNTIKRQQLLHRMLNIPYKLNYNIITLLKVNVI